MKSNSVAEFRRGLLAMTPLMPGIIVFGFLYGVLARQAGLTPFQAWGMSMTVFAGASQFVAAGMWPYAGALTIIVTTFIVNLRHTLLGLSIGPYLAGLPRRRQVALAFWMTDESYALAITEYRQGRGSPQFFLGASLGVYLVWPISGLIGALGRHGDPRSGALGPEPDLPVGFHGIAGHLHGGLDQHRRRVGRRDHRAGRGATAAGDVVRDRRRGIGEHAGAGAGTPPRSGLTHAGTSLAGLRGHDGSHVRHALTWASPRPGANCRGGSNAG